MPITTSAKKALRSSKRKRQFNLARKEGVKQALKTFRKLSAEKKLRDAEIALSAAYKALDKAAKSGLIKKNTASRKKSRLSKTLKKIS